MLTASIVSYHHRTSEIHKVIDCVLAGPVDKLFIIDNSSNDCLRELEGVSDRVRYIHSMNCGYGAGHNIAIREAMEVGAIYHVIVNPDIYFGEGVLEQLVAYMNVNKEIGLVMPKILYPNGELQYLCKLLPTPFDLLLRRFGLWKKYREKRDIRYELRFADYNQEMQVPSLSGCYFMYAEDLDLCRRIGKIAQTMYYPKVSVYHAYAKGSYKNRKLLRYHMCSMFKYFNKWGWLWDIERKTINKRVLNKLGK